MWYYIDQSDLAGSKRGADSCGTMAVNKLSAALVQANRNVFRLYPNPATNQIIVSGADKISKLVILNTLCQVVFEAEYNSDQVNIDLRGMAAGIYFIKINGAEAKRFLKE